MIPAEIALRGLILAQLRGDAALAATVNRIYDGVQAKFTPPSIFVT